MLDYKGYHATVEYRPDDNLLFGRVLDLGDTVVFEVKRAADVQAAFQGAVDEPLDFCALKGKDPSRLFSSLFNLRLTPDLHHAAAIAVEAALL